MTPNLRLLSIAALSAAALSVAACSGMQSQSVGAYVDDSVITARVKAKFAEDESVSATAIRVETINGTVLLKGIAKDATEKSQAETLARGVDGVRAVNNRIDVQHS